MYIRGTPGNAQSRNAWGYSRGTRGFTVEERQGESRNARVYTVTERGGIHISGTRGFTQ